MGTNQCHSGMTIQEIHRLLAEVYCSRERKDAGAERKQDQADARLETFMKEFFQE